MCKRISSLILQCAHLEYTTTFIYLFIWTNCGRGFVAILRFTSAHLVCSKLTAFNLLLVWHILTSEFVLMMHLDLATLWTAHCTGETWTLQGIRTVN